MKAHWWCCVVGLLCVPPWVKSTSTVSQNPASISLTRVNSSADIGCSTSRPEPMSLTLYRGFPANERVVFLALNSGQVTKQTPAAEFVGRIRVAQRAGPAHGFTLQLSLLGLRDTNLYYCQWGFFNAETSSLETLHSAGTVIVVREKDPQELCKDHVFDRILIALSAAAFSVVVGLCIAALVVKRKRFKRSFRSARGATPPARPNRLHVTTDDPYLFRYVNSLDIREASWNAESR